MAQFIRRYLEKLVSKEGSCHKLALSFSVGTFIALMPIIPFQTPLLFLVSWLMRLNAAVVFGAVYVVNNPITLVPIYIMNYAVGSWVFNKFLGLDLQRFNPWWMDQANAWLSKYIDITKYLGEGLCLWCLLLGGLMVSTVLAAIAYPVMLHLCSRLSRKRVV
jgi:uncharacterized protein (DUF2062 family)